MKIQDLFSKEVITLFSNNEMFDKVIHNIKNNRLLFKEVHYKYIFKHYFSVQQQKSGSTHSLYFLQILSSSFIT